MTDTIEMHARMHKTVLMHVRGYQNKLKSTVFKFYFNNVYKIKMLYDDQILISMKLN